MKKGSRLKLDSDIDVDSLPATMSANEFRKLLQSGGEDKAINVPVENHPHAKPIPTVLYGKKIKEIVDLPIRSKAFFIPGQVLSSKNHKRILKRRLKKKELAMEAARGNYTRKYRYFIGNTDAVHNYKAKTAKYFRMYAEEFRQTTAGMCPVFVEFLFIRRTKAVNWDFSNMVQLIQDQMRDYGWIEDDNIINFCPVPPLDGPVVVFDQKNPGVRITVLHLRKCINN